MQYFNIIMLGLLSCELFSLVIAFSNRPHSRRFLSNKLVPHKIIFYSSRGSSGSYESSASNTKGDDVNETTDYDSDLFLKRVLELDAEIYDETILEQSITKAVKQLVEQGPAEPQPTPLEKFDKIYKGIKNRKAGEAATTLDPSQMLETLFGTEVTREPFDERKVMLKLRNMLDPEDFKTLFIDDPTIGDWL